MTIMIQQPRYLSNNLKHIVAKTMEHTFVGEEEKNIETHTVYIPSMILYKHRVVHINTNKMFNNKL